MIELVDVQKSFGANHVIRGFSASVTKGEVVCIIGPSGSGKSTILRCINGLIPIDGGSIRVADFQVEKLTADRDIIALRKEVSIVFQQYNLYPHKTALANIMPRWLARGRERKARCRNAFGCVTGHSDPRRKRLRRRWQKHSGGTARRTAGVPVPS